MMSPGAATRLHVQGLAPETTTKELATRFDPFGEVSGVVVVRARANADGTYDESTASKGFGYVTLHARDAEQIAHCLRTYNGLRWRGKVLRISHAKEYYRDRLARERHEAACGYTSADGAGGAEEEQQQEEAKACALPTQVRIRGHLAGQVAVVELADPPNVRTAFPDDGRPVQPSRISWEPIRGDGQRTRGSRRWAQGALESGEEQEQPAVGGACDLRPVERTHTVRTRDAAAARPSGLQRRRPALRALAKLKGCSGIVRHARPPTVYSRMDKY